MCKKCRTYVAWNQNISFLSCNNYKNAKIGKSFSWFFFVITWFKQMLLINISFITDNLLTSLFIICLNTPWIQRESLLFTTKMTLFYRVLLTKCVKVKIKNWNSPWTPFNWHFCIFSTDIFSQVTVTNLPLFANDGNFTGGIYKMHND